ncbi:hypothetical protein NPIL_125091 [Nephila pilipes]|uniref:Uncharacterized protein n=1 Tax=Nephila pilipes TaxID=299642 RepID=A0A8X6QE76_NEPPI|nr:hypothetical protein NPIL_125091 [Nephila pilipes]
MEVNTFGVVRITKAFLPLLRKSKGRIINITSLAGRTTLQYMGPYFMSKHATVAFNDCLRKELGVWGIRVISIEPDFFATQLTNQKLVDENIDASISLIPNDLRSDYGEKFLDAFIPMKRYLFQFTSSKTKIVIDALDSAITLKYPDSIYEPRGSILTTVLIKIYTTIPYAWQDFVFSAGHYILGFPKPKTAS